MSLAGSEPPFRGKSVLNRILFAFFGVTLVNLLFLTIFVNTSGWHFINHLTDENLKVLMTVVENSIIDDMYRSDYTRLENIFDQTLLDKAGINSCRIFDRDGVLIAQGGSDDLSPYTFKPDPLGVKIVKTEGFYIDRQIHYKIIGWRYSIGNEILGGAAASFSNDLILNQMKKIIIMLVSASLIIIGCGGLVFYILLRQISSPLRNLAAIMKHYGEETFELDFQYQRNDEIRILSDSLKRMSAQVKDSFERLKRSEERFDLAVQGSKDGVWEYRSDNHELYASPRCRSLLGMDMDEKGRGFRSWFSRIVEDDKDRMRNALKRVREHDAEYLDVECRFRRDDGHVVWIRTRGRGVYNENNRCVRIAGSFSDVTDRKNAEERLMQVALYDSLTKLPNRLLLLERLKQIVERYKRRPESEFSLLYLDYDGFKKVNDTYGHSVGDFLLRAIAARLKRCVRSQDTICRIGGDEFVILLDECGGRGHVTEIAERILLSSSKEFNLKNNSIFLTVSIGIFMGGRTSGSPEDMIQAADIAMYNAKNDGKGMYHFYHEEMQKKISTKWKIHNDLHKALDRKELFLVYQPIVSLQDMRLRGAEALLRWQHPSRGLISPVDFIPSAEETSFITNITDWILRELRTVYKASFSGVRDRRGIRIGFNVSSRDFTSSPTVLVRIIETFSGWDDALNVLDVEVTETSLIDNFEAVSSQLSRLREKGMRVKLDDFGTGYSSLSYLHNFPLDSLKIDRSFVRTLPGDRDNLNIIRHLIDLAHDLGLEVVAEGVETAQQHHTLKALGCDKGQGYLYSTPLMLHDFLGFQDELKALTNGLEEEPDMAKSG